MSDIVAGAVFSAAFPFVRAMFDAYPEDGFGLPEEKETWRPGTDSDFDGCDDFVSVADGVGSVIYTVVDTHKPGRYPTRVFYTRQWRDPDGKVFGKNKLRITTQQAFRRLIQGWRHEYQLSENA